ncbi:MAG: SUMF1/EgtB/PvdO family nonheme iron enzyme [Nanoarchaeota archaeon]|nr:SUMF1/EgtB/PvdO family nonheme iron enzyme [Nanoarchaeota archaeon]
MKAKIIFFLVFLILIIGLVGSVLADPVLVGTVGVSPQGVHEGCAGKRFGLVGASNTVDQDPQGNKVHPSMREILEQSCPGSTVFLNAMGGYGPQAQKSLLSSLLAQHSDLDYVILDVSVNQIRESSLEDYTEDVVELAQMVKEKNPNIKVVVLTPTPFKGPNYWSQAQQDKQDAFNQNLLNNKLGTSFIDYAVDVYSALEDPPGSDSCGRYCKGDNLHFYDGTGRKVVIKTMLDTVFGTPKTATVVTNTPVSPTAGVSPISSGLAAENCLNKQRCDEIDEVWLKIVSWINVARKNHIWDTVRNEWRQKGVPPAVTVTPGVVVTPTPVPVPSVSATGIAPLAMEGGDPYLRAFMRMITKYEGTAKTCNGISPYQILVGGSVSSDPQGRYGGKLSGGCYGNYFNGFDGHPKVAVEWNPGSPTSNAAGRYQFLASSWENKYAPLSSKGANDFSPQNQDEVVHNWLKNQGIDQLLRDAGANSDPNDESFRDVWQTIMETKRIGKEWASLPYGCYNAQGCYKRDSQRFRESAEIYAQLLKEELGVSSSPTLPSTGGATFSACPSDMANIDDEYCVDKWEDIVVDKTTLQQASYNWVSDPKLVNGQKLLPPNPPQPSYPEASGTQFSSSFVPAAVSMPGVFPQTYVNRNIAETACANAGKRLCTRVEWYNACVGPTGQKVAAGATTFPEVMPYGGTRESGACNDNKQNLHPPIILGQSQVLTQDPRLAGKAQEIGAAVKTGELSQCTNEYGVFDMAGNVDEIVSDTPVENKNNMMFVGGYYSRAQTGINGIHCGSRIIAHGASYYDYSVGFRCCATLS